MLKHRAICRLAQRAPHRSLAQSPGRFTVAAKVVVGTLCGWAVAAKLNYLGLGHRLAGEEVGAARLLGGGGGLLGGGPHHGQAAAGLLAGGPGSRSPQAADGEGLDGAGHCESVRVDV